MCHFVFDYNSGFSWSIFVHIVPVETGRNTLRTTKQNLPLHLRCVSTLPGETKTTYKQHIVKSNITVRSFGLILFATFAESRPMFIFSYSW